MALNGWRDFKAGGAPMTTQYRPIPITHEIGAFY
jgi:hypothetical protein